MLNFSFIWWAEPTLQITAVLNNSVKKSAIGPGATLHIFQNYKNNKTKVAGLDKDRKALVDQFTDALKAKDEDMVKSKWDKIKNG